MTIGRFRNDGVLGSASEDKYGLVVAGEKVFVSGFVQVMTTK